MVFCYLKVSTTVALCCATLIGACGSGPVRLADRDTTGAHDGFWIGRVAGPRATRVSLPGKYYMRCDWQPFELYLEVRNGMVQLGSLVDQMPISSAGEFRFDVISGGADTDQGLMNGNAKFVDVFTGSLAPGDASGIFSQYVTSIGRNGCSAKIHFRRQSEPGYATGSGPVV